MAKIILRAGKVAIKIILPLVILGLIFYSVKVLVPAQAEVGSFPDELSAQFDQAETYQEQGRYAEAEQIYQGIIEQYPLTDYHFEAQRQLTILYINWNKPAEAEAALQEFVRIYSNYAGVAEAVCEVFDRYREFNPIKAIEIFQYALDTWPESDHAMWAQAGLVQSYMVLGDEAGAQAAIEKLLTGYSEDENIADIVIYIANEYWHSSPQALELFEYAISTWPDNKDAIWARAGLIKANIAFGNDPNDPEAVDELLEQFSESEFIVEAVLSIGDSYYDVRKYENALELYEYAMSTWPDNKDAIWAGAGLIKANIAFGNDTNVPEAVDELLEQFSGSEFIVEAVLSIAGSYYNVRKYENALELYEYAISTWPDSKDAIWARAGLIKADAFGNDPNDQQLNELLTDFSGHPGLPQAIFDVAERYYVEAFVKENEGDSPGATKYLQEAIGKWKDVSNGLYGTAPPFLAAEAPYLIAESYYRLGEYQEAINNYKQVTANWPDFKRIQHVYLMIGGSYERLKKANVLSQSVADPEIINSYQKVVESNPDSYAAAIAAARLSGYQTQ